MPHSHSFSFFLSISQLYSVLINCISISISFSLSLSTSSRRWEKRIDGTWIRWACLFVTWNDYLSLSLVLSLSTLFNSIAIRDPAHYFQVTMRRCLIIKSKLVKVDRRSRALLIECKKLFEAINSQLEFSLLYLSFSLYRNWPKRLQLSFKRIVWVLLRNRWAWRE